MQYDLNFARMHFLMVEVVNLTEALERINERPSGYLSDFHILTKYKTQQFK